MANVFDQFDAPQAAQGGNVFDQFDAPQSPGYLSRVGSDISGSLQKGADILTKEPGNPLSNALQIGGQAANAVFAPATELVKSGYNSLPDSITQPINNAASGAAQAIKSTFQAGIDKLADTSAGKAVGDYGMNSPNLRSNMQGLSDAAKGAANLVTLAPLSKAIEATAPIAGDALQTAGQVVSNSADARTLASKTAFAQDLTMPKATPKIGNDILSRSTTSGWNDNPVFNPSPMEKQVADTVAQLPVSPSNNILDNYNIIKDANTQEAQSLIDKLKQNDVPIPDDKILSTLSDVRNNLAKSPYIVGDGAKAADSVINNALDIISKNHQTASGILQSRKDLDALISNQKGAKTFNPNLDGPVTNAVQQVRQAMNGLVADAVPDAGVQASLAKQSNLYTAMDNIETKLSSTPITKTARMGAALSNLVPATTAGKVAASAAVPLGLGAAYMAPAAAGVAAAGYGAYKLGKAVLSPTAQSALGTILSTTGGVLNGDAIRQIMTKVPPTTAREILGNIRQ